MKRTNKRKYRYGRIIAGILVIVTLSFLAGYFVSQSHPVIIANNGVNTISEIYEILEEKWLNPNEEIDFQQAAAAGLVSGLNDKYSSYMTTEQTAIFNASMDGSLIGIGVNFIAIEKGAMITQVVNNSPASQTDLKAGDIIISSDGSVLEGLTAQQMKDLITGEQGTVAKLQVEYLSIVREVAITREYIATASIASIRQAGDQTFGYLEINTFGELTAQEVKGGLELFADNNVTTLVIDLRSNGGGLISACSDILNLFVEEGGLIYSIETNDNPLKDYYSSGDVITSFKKGYILINDATASAAEILAGSLVDNLGYVTVGDTTFGKGIAQVSVPLTDGATLKYTYAKWYLPNGSNIQGTGIAPAVPVDEGYDFAFNDMALEEDIALDCVDVDSLKPIQLALNTLGYQCRDDGYFDQGTLEAINKFQADNELDKTVGLDNQTYLAVISKSLNFVSLETNDNIYNKVIELIK